MADSVETKIEQKTTDMYRDVSSNIGGVVNSLPTGRLKGRVKLKPAEVIVVFGRNSEVFKATISTHVRPYETQAARSAETISRQTEALKKSEADYGTLKNQYEQLTAANEKLQQELTDAQTQLEQAGANYDGAMTQVRQLQDTVTDLDGRLERIAPEIPYEHLVSTEQQTDADLIKDEHAADVRNAVRIGQITGYDPATKIAAIKLTGAIEGGIELYFKGPQTDFTQTAGTIYLGGGIVDKINAGVVGLHVTQKVNEGDAVYKLDSQ